MVTDVTSSGSIRCHDAVCTDPRLRNGEVDRVLNCIFMAHLSIATRLGRMLTRNFGRVLNNCIRVMGNRNTGPALSFFRARSVILSSKSRTIVPV